MNMLRKWYVPTTPSYWAEELLNEDEDGEFSVWNEGPGSPISQPILGSQLNLKQREQLERLLEGFVDTLKSHPGRTKLVKHYIPVESGRPVILPPYRLPHAYRDIVQQESGVIEPSTSGWVAPVVATGQEEV